MEITNEYGLDPSKLTKEELVNEIITIGDFATMGDCIRYLYDIDKELATQSLLQVLTTDEEAEKYGDEYFQAMFLNNLFNNKEVAIQYVSDNYKDMHPYTLAVALDELIIEDEDNKTIREELKIFVEQNKNTINNQLQGASLYKDIVKEFLESFE